MRAKKFPLTRAKVKLYDKRFGVFDVETDGLGGTFLDSVAEFEIGSPIRCATPDDLFDQLLDVPRDGHGKLRSFTWYAHNLGGYDALYLIPAMIEHGQRTGWPVETIAQGQKIIGYVIRTDRGDGKTARITLVDSLPLLQASLDKVSAVYAPDHRKLGHCPDHDFTAGGTYSPSCPECYRYLRGDCDALLATMRAVEEQEHKVFGINLKITGGSAGVELLKRTLPEGEAHYRQAPDKEAFLYECVYGGYVWPGRDTLPHEDVVKRDCTAAYAARAREGVPVGTGAWTGKFEPDFPGFYRVTAWCPESTPVPLVPNRAKSAEKHVVPLWPTGEWETWIPSNVLLFAEQHGYKFIVHEGIVFPKLGHPYDNMMNMLERMECPEAGEVDEAVKLGCKIKRNSVIGKAATKPEQDRVMIGECPPGFTPVIDEKGGTLPFWIKTEKVTNGAHIQPHWNSWITAAQRITVQNILIAAGDAARYADTDCAAYDREADARLVASGIIPVSDRKMYGTWPVEDEWDWFQVGGPKNYTGQIRGGPRKSKAKGVRQPRRKDGDEWELYLQAQKDTIDGVARPEIVFESVRGARDLLKNPEGPIGIVRRRRFSTLAGSSTWRVDAAGQIRPYHLE